jgi:NDP-sugar pyrophosphorylase family protein
VDVVVIAAGEGRRLRPLTERWPKPMLPIDGRPVLATLLRALGEEGFHRVVLVTGHLAEQTEALAGDGSAFGLELVRVRQPRAVGSADAVRRALEGGAEPPLVVCGADTVFRRGALRRFADAAAATDGAIAVRRDPPPEPPTRYAVRIEDGRVTKVLDPDPSNPLAGAPLWLLGPALVRLLEGLPGPPFELAEAFQRGVDAGLRVHGVEIGRTRDLTDPLDLVRENFPYLGAI